MEFITIRMKLLNNKLVLQLRMNDRYSFEKCYCNWKTMAK